jgi:hypothetical protein
MTSRTLFISAIVALGALLGYIVAYSEMHRVPDQP